MLSLCTVIWDFDIMNYFIYPYFHSNHVVIQLLPTRENPVFDPLAVQHLNIYTCHRKVPKRMLDFVEDYLVGVNSH